MQEPTPAGVVSVPLDIYDFTYAQPEGIAPGFYYSVPSEASDPTQLYLSGPYETRQDTFDAARDFVLDALKDHQTQETT